MITIRSVPSICILPFFAVLLYLFFIHGQWAMSILPRIRESREGRESEIDGGFRGSMAFLSIYLICLVSWLRSGQFRSVVFTFVCVCVCLCSLFVIFFLFFLFSFFMIIGGNRFSFFSFFFFFSMSKQSKARAGENWEFWAIYLSLSLFGRF